MASRPLTLAFLSALLVFAAVPAAEAHRLRVFATVEAGTVSGYGFFIGGGRPAGAALWAETAEGAEIFRGETDAEGRFSFTPPDPADLIISLDVGDGHVATAGLAADRFGPPGETGSLRPAPSSPGTASPAIHLTAGEAGRPGSPAETVTLTREALHAMIDRSVEAAVARQIRPLLESYAAAESRLRFNDIAGGIGMIVGLGGMALWISSRKHGQTGAARSGEPG